MNASLKPAGDKTGILQVFYINTMATDDLRRQGTSNHGVEREG